MTSQRSKIDSGEKNLSINKLITKPPRTDEELRETLKELTSDEQQLEKLYTEFRKKYADADRHAKKFMRAFHAKHVGDISKGELLRRARKYANKYNLSDDVFALFLNMFKETHKMPFGKYDRYAESPMAKTLGIELKQSTGLTYKESDKINLQGIKELHETSREISKQIKLQALQYRESTGVALNGKFDPHRDNVYNYVNPAIAALFIPQIQVLEERMIFANFTDLVVRLNSKEIIDDLPTMYLIDDLARDPNQNSDNDTNLTPLKDLYIRSLIQVQLWIAILNLRMGNYYNFKPSKLDEALNNYPSNIYDAPDLALAQDSGAWLRKLLNAFSLRPTRVERSKIPSPDYHMFKGNFVDLTSTIDFVKTEDFTEVPMITVRLPPKVSTPSLTRPIRITADLNTIQWYTDPFGPTIYNQRIVFSNGIILFYINRQYSQINQTSKYDRYKPFTFAALPPSISGTSQLNDIPVDFDDVLPIGDRHFNLKSVICYEAIGINENNIVTGSSAIINVANDQTGEVLHCYYNPQRAGTPIDGIHVDPITILSNIGYNTAQGQSYEEIVRIRGSVFCYVHNK